MVNRGGHGAVTVQSRTIIGPSKAMGQPWAHNRPTLLGHISMTSAIGPGDLDMAERKSRDLPIEVLTCSVLGHHADYGQAKVDTANSTTSAISLQVTPRVCRLCMCVSRHV